MRLMICAMLTAGPALADITFPTDSGVVVVRHYQDGTNVRYELISDFELVQCVAVGMDGAPLAVDTTLPEMGFSAFRDLKAEEVADIVCREAGL